MFDPLFEWEKQAFFPNLNGYYGRLQCLHGRFEIAQDIFNKSNQQKDLNLFLNLIKNENRNQFTLKDFEWFKNAERNLRLTNLYKFVLFNLDSNSLVGSKLQLDCLMGLKDF